MKTPRLPMGCGAGPVQRARRPARTAWFVALLGAAPLSTAAAPVAPFAPVAPVAAVAPVAPVAVPAAPAPAATSWHWRLELEVETERNVELERADPTRRTRVEPLLRLGWRHAPSASVDLFGELELEGRVELRRARPSTRRSALRVNQAHATMALPVGSESMLRIGRWLQRDEREWLFDESLDGVRWRLHAGAWQAELLAGGADQLPRDLLEPDRRSRAGTVWGALIRRDAGHGATLGGYLLGRHGAGGDGPRFDFAGLRAHGQRSDGALHWVELGLVRGRGSDGRRVHGWAVDAGGVVDLSALALAAARPRLIAGLAWSSGDDGTTRVDRGYRQTGLQGNEAALGSLVKRKIYGETLDPELGNLRVVSLGLGSAPRAGLTVDLVAHHYAQVVPAPVRGLAVKPGRDDLDGRTLGHALDLLLGWQPTPAFKLEAAVGRFNPGPRLRHAAAGGDAAAAGHAVFGRVGLAVRF